MVEFCQEIWKVEQKIRDVQSTKSYKVGAGSGIVHWLSLLKMSGVGLPGKGMLRRTGQGMLMLGVFYYFFF